FAPTNAQQARMLEYLFKKFAHVGVERVCSGIGIPNIYEFLRDAEGLAEDPEVAARIAAAPDQTKAIVEAALDPASPSKLCRATAEMMVSILAAETGNLALKVLSTGGVYITGGVALHLLELMKKPAFMRAFINK